MVTALEYVSELVSLPPPIEVIKTECLSLKKCVSTDNLNTASLQRLFYVPGTTTQAWRKHGIRG